MDPDTTRGRVLVEESREAVIVLDDADNVVLASRRARQTIEGISEGAKIPEGILSGDFGIVPLIVPYDVGSLRERLPPPGPARRRAGHHGAGRAPGGHTRGGGRDSPRRCRTSYARRSPACSRCSRWPRCPVRTSTPS